MNELKPCPFCGGEAEVRRYQNVFSAVCCDEDCAAYNGLYRSEAEAALHWNTRAERTCYIKERLEVSNRTGVVRELVFLSCGHIAEPRSKFCKKCGAKVVEYD